MRRSTKMIRWTGVVLFLWLATLALSLALYKCAVNPEPAHIDAVICTSDYCGCMSTD